MASNLTAAIRKGMAAAIPIKQKSPADYLKIDDETKVLIKERNRIRRLYRKNGTIMLKRKLKLLNEEVKISINNLRIKRWNDKLATLNEKDGSIWKTARALRKIPPSDPEIKTENKTLTKAMDKAEYIADYSEKIFTPSKPGLKTPHINIEEGDDTECVHPTFSISEVVQTLKILPLKAPGEDTITNEMLRKLTGHSSEYITTIINASIKWDTFRKYGKNRSSNAYQRKGKVRQTGRPETSLLSLNSWKTYGEGGN
jgi:hypothetical protein